MNKSRCSDSQIIVILKQAKAATPATDLCREHGMSDVTFYKWQAKSRIGIKHETFDFINDTFKFE
jgi:hypothetical protein